MAIALSGDPNVSGEAAASFIGCRSCPGTRIRSAIWPGIEPAGLAIPRRLPPGRAGWDVGAKRQAQQRGSLDMGLPDYDHPARDPPDS